MQLLMLVLAALAALIPSGRPDLAPAGDGAGGSGGSDDPDDDGGDDDEEDGGDDDGSDDDETDWKAEASKWKKLARKHEDRSKANAKAKKDLDDLRKKHMDDQERAVEEAREEARSEAQRLFGGRIVDAEIKAAAAGRISDEALEALIENLDRTKFLTDDGDVDTDRVADFVEGIAPPKGEEPDKGAKKKPDMGQGRRRRSDKPTVKSGADLYRDRHPAKTST